MRCRIIIHEGMEVNRMQREYKEGEKVMVKWAGDEEKMDGPHTIQRKGKWDSYVVIVYEQEATYPATVATVPAWWIYPYREIEDGRPCVAVDENGMRYAYGNYAGDDAIDTGAGAVFIEEHHSIKPIYKTWRELTEEEKNSFKNHFLRMLKEDYKDNNYYYEIPLTSLTAIPMLWNKAMYIASEEDF